MAPADSTPEPQGGESAPTDDAKAPTPAHLDLERPDLERASDKIAADLRHELGDKSQAPGGEGKESFFWFVKPVFGLGRVLVLVVVLLALLVVFFLLSKYAGWLAATLGAVALLNILVWAVTRVTPRFGWYAVAVFVSVMSLGAIVSMVRTALNVQVQPVVVIRTGEDVAVCGIYITETDKRIYIGRLEQPKSKNWPVAVPANIFWIPETEVDMVRLGALDTQARLVGDTRALASELYADRAEQQRSQIPASTKVTVRTGRGKESTQITSGLPAIDRHPVLKGRPPDDQVCTRRGGRMVSPKYDP